MGVAIVIGVIALSINSGVEKKQMQEWAKKNYPGVPILAPS